MPGFPTWFMAMLAAGASVWLATQVNTKYAWYLAVLLVLGVLVMRDNGLAQLDALISDILHQKPAPASSINVPSVF